MSHLNPVLTPATQGAPTAEQQGPHKGVVDFPWI